MIIDAENKDELLYLAGVINSKLMIYFIKQKYSSSSYNGGINFTKDMINSLPWVVDELEYSAIVELVKRIIELEADKINEIGLINEKINSIIYKIYGITPEEVESIEAG